VTLGVGVGWLKEEFEILDVPFGSRAERTDEAIGVLRALWTQDPATFHGTHFDFEGARSHPRPAQPGGVPIVVGGHSPSAAARAGRLGDGFFPAKGDPELLRSLLDVMRNAAEEAGRDPGAIELTTGSRGRDADSVLRLAELGVDRVVIPPPAFEPAGLREGLERFAGEVMSKVR
jgi:alkanesulfonate monooxygenase SsuD/methylene tetrahydromethanopterin reductase-like flavin-dependent oxidoreductase (luciferase family)